MNSLPNGFISKQAVDDWIQNSLASGLSANLIFAVMQKKSEELNAKRAYYLLRRREELVKGNTRVATELHLLMKDCEQQASWFSELSGSLMNFSVKRKREKKISELFRGSAKMNGIMDNLN